VFAEPGGPGYAIVGTPKLYCGQTVTVEGVAGERDGRAMIRPFARCFSGKDGRNVSTGTTVVYGDDVALEPNAAFALVLPVPGERGFPVKDIGMEITGGPGAAGSVFVDTVRFSGAPDIHIADELPRDKDGTVLGWVVDADRVIGKFPQDAQPMTYFGKDTGRGVIITGTDDWTDYTISARFTVALADAGGLVARYQGLQRYLALIKTEDALKLVANYYGETVLAEAPCTWQVGELHDLALTVKGSDVAARLDGQQILTATDDRLTCGGAGYIVERGLAGFRETAITG
jgi:hypothetical protein